MLFNLNKVVYLFKKDSNSEVRFKQIDKIVTIL